MLFLLMPIAVQAQESPAPVVVELFSSQACPACPPADAYLKILSKSDGVIALSCHVDYFNVRGPNLGKAICTNRQSKYIKQIGRKKLYTPQMMVNGHMNVIGYETGKVAAKITKAKSDGVSKIMINPKAYGVYNFSLPVRQFSGQANLLLAVYDKPRTVSHRGRAMTYYNVVSHFLPLGQWGGSAISRPVFPALAAKSAGFAIIAQDIKTGKVLAAGDYRL